MDDEEPIRHVLVGCAVKLGHSVEVVSTGAEAIERYRRSLEEGARFDVVILDLTVPGDIGGGVAARELLRLDDEARLIVSSGYSTDPVLSHYEQYGFRAAIPKPYRFEDVSRVLTHVLKKNGGDGRRRSILTEE